MPSEATTTVFAAIPRPTLDYRQAAEFLGMTDVSDRSDASVKRALNRLCDKGLLNPTVTFGTRTFRIVDLHACLDKLAGSGDVT